MAASNLAKLRASNCQNSIISLRKIFISNIDKANIMFQLINESQKTQISIISGYFFLWRCLSK